LWFDSQQTKTFLYCTAYSSILDPSQRAAGSFPPQVKRVGRAVAHFPQSGSEVKNK